MHDENAEKYRVKLDAFEGPMELLLHLIQVNKIDIYDIPIAAVKANSECFSVNFRNRFPDQSLRVFCSGTRFPL